MASSSDGESKRRFGRSPKESGATKAPKAPGRLAQVKQVYQMTAKADPALPWILIGTVLVILAIFLLLGWLWGGGSWVYLVYMGVIGLPLGILAATLILGSRAKKAAYKQIEGMPGSSLAALQELGRGWSHEEQPVATEAVGKVRGVRDMGQAAMVFRAVGRPGVVLVCEGPAAAAQRLAAAERKRVA